MKITRIRNFCIIAHIDHGKSTLADRMIEFTGGDYGNNMRAQLLDDLELERERGITIKLKAIRMSYFLNRKDFQFNLIDTPGHIDFGYEVSRALAACEGAILLVDATQGVQAQTIVNFEKARAENLKIIPVINKIDLSSADVEKTVFDIVDLGFQEKEILLISAKTGEGVQNLLSRIVDLIPHPRSGKGVTRGLIFDSLYDDYRGVIAFVRMLCGKISSTDRIKFLATKAESKLVGVGYLSPKEISVDMLENGEVGFIATGLKDIDNVRVGDTVTLADELPIPVAGYKKPVPVVFLSLYPEDSSKYPELREAMEKLRLNDASFSFEPESIGSIGKGFRCGFLGLLHADIIKERIEREFKVNVITTLPSVRYIVEKISGEILAIKSPVEYSSSAVRQTKEPWIKLDIYTPSKYMGVIMDFCKSRRAKYIETNYIKGRRLKISYNLPLIEFIVDFYDKLKSISSGYASVDYELADYKEADVVKLDIYIAGNEVKPLAQLVQRCEAHREGKRMVERLKELIPRQNFKVSLQAAIGGKFIAREDISALRKDVTGYLYGGDVTRKKKLLEKQKKGKKRMQRFGKVNIPQDVFRKVMER